MRRLCLGLLGLALIAQAAHAQRPGPDSGPPADTTRALAEIAVGAAAPEAAATVRRISPQALRALAPTTVAEAAVLAPSATVRTNSRGETLVYLRGSGERQVVTLFDGAPLTVPWDRRVDLSLVPAGVVGQIAVAQGASSVVWGPNALGGAIELVPRRLDAPGTAASLETQAALPLGGRVSADYARRAAAGGALTLAADGSWSRGDAAEGALPFSQSGALRTNTDRGLLAGVARLDAPLSAATDAGMTVLLSGGQKGVAPEGHLDPDQNRVRFWRYAGVANALVIGRVRHRGTTALDASVWAGGFGQTIDQFESAAYEALDDRQHDRDLSAGSRVVAARETALGTFTGTLFGVAAEHRQTDGVTETLTETFRHAEWSAGAEWERRIVGLTLSAGGGLDGLAPWETAGRASAGTFSAWTGHAGARLRVTDALTVRAGGGRKARFPSMRELFGEALGRFALNPELGPETARLAEAGVEVQTRRASGEIVAFGRWTDGTIEQERLDDGRRRRVNLGSSRVLGVEAGGAARLGEALRLDGSLTLMDITARDGDGATAVLSETPHAVGRLAALWTRGRVSAAVDAVGTGAAVSPGPDGPIDLAPTVRVGGRAGYRFPAGGGIAEAFARVDNAFDVASFPQAGLPLPGRSLRLGLRLVR